MRFPVPLLPSLEGYFLGCRSLQPRSALATTGRFGRSVEDTCERQGEAMPFLP